MHKTCLRITSRDREVTLHLSTVILYGEKEKGSKTLEENHSLNSGQHAGNFPIEYLP